MTLTFILVFLICFYSPLYMFFLKMGLASCICKFCQNYLLYMFYPWVTCILCHVLFYRLIVCLDKYVCFSFDKTYICLEVCLVLIKIIFSYFMVSYLWKWNSIFVLDELSFIALSPCICWLHDSCALYILYLLMFRFMRICVLYKLLSVNSHVIFLYDGIYMLLFLTWRILY